MPAEDLLMGQAQDIGDICCPDAGLYAGCQLDKLSQELAAFAQAQLEISAKLDQVLEESGSSATRQALKICTDELMFMMQKMRCRVVWQDGDPNLRENT